MLRHLTLLWRKHSPLEEQLFAAVRDLLPPPARAIFDVQVSGITHVQRLSGGTEIDLYRLRGGKTDWSDIPSFPNTGEFPLAEIRFSVKAKRYKARLSCISGHIFDFGLTPSAKSIAFATWDKQPKAELVGDPMLATSTRTPEPIPAIWQDFLARHPQTEADEWTFNNADTARRVYLREGEFLILAERGDEFVLHRLEPPGEYLFYLETSGATPERIEGLVDEMVRNSD
jgi:hypothetical protein